MRGRARMAAVGVLLVAGCSAAEGGRGTVPVATAPATARPSQAAAGHPHAAAAVPPAAPLRAGERFSTVTVRAPYVPEPPPGATDDYRCFLVDPGLTAPAYLTGSQFLPSNTGLVHHAIFYRIDRSDVADAQQLDRAQAGDGWTCFGGTGVGGSGPARRLAGGGDWVAAWAPGSGESVAPAGTGYLLRPGGRLVMQVHYNLLRAVAGGTDRPGIRLRLRDGAAPLTPLRTTLLPAPVELPCAPGETGPLCDREAAVLDVMRRFGAPSGATVAGLTLLCSRTGRPVPGSVQSCDHRVTRASTLYALAGHMHLLGTKITVQLDPGTPRARTLLDVPSYDFHDQRPVPLPAPVRVVPGETYRVTCTHDARQRRFTDELKDRPPRYVVWGDGTTDEMCLAIVVGTA